MPIDPFTLVSPPLFAAADLREIEHRWTAAHPGRPLMARAGAAAADLACTLARDTGEPILVLAGPGNNGGDAVVTARLLAAQGFRVVVVSRADPARLPPDAAHAWTDWRDAGGNALTDVPAGQSFGLVVDGLYGVGLVRAIEGEDARWIGLANAMACPRLALDVPSGLDGDTGQVRGCAVRADHTLTFLGLKPGLLTADGPDHAGTLHLDALGVEPDMLPAVAGSALTRLETRHRLPPRPRNSHKGVFGHAGVVGGAQGMVGAALIAGRAALAYGAGAVTLGVLDARVAVDYGEPRLMFAPPERLVAAPLDVLALGPGLGQAAQARALLETALASTCPLVLDADALNLLAGDPALSEMAARRTAPTLLTPHPGEAARLLACGTYDVQADRIAAASMLARRFRAHVALKGAGTVVTHPQGRYAINTTGGPHLAQAGSGDRLTGIVVALLAQGMAPGDALEAAVWRHGSEPSIPPAAI